MSKVWRDKKLHFAFWSDEIVWLSDLRFEEVIEFNELFFIFLCITNCCASHFHLKLLCQMTDSN